MAAGLLTIGYRYRQASFSRRDCHGYTQIEKEWYDLNPTADGKLILILYTEQHPLMLSNSDMASDGAS